MRRRFWELAYSATYGLYRLVNRLCEWAYGHYDAALTASRGH